MEVWRAQPGGREVVAEEEGWQGKLGLPLRWGLVKACTSSPCRHKCCTASSRTTGSISKVDSPLFPKLHGGLSLPQVA